MCRHNRHRPVTFSPESLATGLRIHPGGGPVSDRGIRRRDADGGGRDDRAPKDVANDWGIFRILKFICQLDSICPGKHGMMKTKKHNSNFKYEYEYEK
jgi:hypothetical protein